MHLVHIQRPGVSGTARFFLSKIFIGPQKPGDIVKLAGGGGAGFRVEAIGVRLIADLPVRPGDGVFIRGIPGQLRYKAGPRLPLPRERRSGTVPFVKIPHHAHRLGMGRPDSEAPALPARLPGRMGAKPGPAV
ncbi:hypothetical protein SDC9_85352 [bioreactor metagenome]|uniref:Uncharacterized protein n=1 Tax=bioreactor metagenome TaxID=1076179 RepID=A0A644ZCU6_9ZZZZ